ncbi:hypothetical protein [Sphingomonas edaphi]|uniref:Uncharacterized protein n=1 Tax=Sphingomonas edaphi TaxID=2315689 RepID=A0A418PYQ3_9SPHN|nr:hypothetical protein [Sphingomonas edaphi]RIX27407.1 hypothetical protein D3M59_10225 [Sphingomonas edaphi]
MTAFEFVFPLFGLLVGLTYTEMLAGLARALKSSRHVRIGWLVPLLGILVLINLTMFWYGAWQMRHLAVPTSGTLLMTLLVGGTYYLAASLVFPNAEDNVADLDEHFVRTRRPSLIAIAFCNLLGLALVARNAGWSMPPIWWIVNAIFLIVLIVTAYAQNRRLIAGLLVLMIGFHGLGVLLGR